MKKMNLMVSLCVAIIFLVVGLKYIPTKKVETENLDQTTSVTPTVSGKILRKQDGLPDLVEAKRQAIYQAAISRDFGKLKLALGLTDGSFLSTLDADGKSSSGFSGFTELIEYEKNISIFDLIPYVLERPYKFWQNSYWWEGMSQKDNWLFSASNITNMKKFFTEKQIKTFETYYDNYPKIIINPDGGSDLYFFYD